MKRALIFLMLTACAPQAPVFKPVSVEIPVAVPCHTASVAKPDFALSHVTAADDMLAKTKAALIELDQRKAYEAELESGFAVCP
jgi:hypothetical protein